MSGQDRHCAAMAATVATPTAVMEASLPAGCSRGSSAAAGDGPSEVRWPPRHSSSRPRPDTASA
eukprot:6576959-Prymnesium_polylepis.1